MEQRAELAGKEASLCSQVMLDLYGCKSDYLDDLEWVENVLIEAANYGGAFIIDVVFHKLKPSGIVGVIIIADSHLTVRTWPEYRYAAVEIFTAGKAFDCDAAVAQVATRFRCAKRSLTAIERGTAAQLAEYPGAAAIATAAADRGEARHFRKYPFQF